MTLDKGKRQLRHLVIKGFLYTLWTLVAGVMIYFQFVRSPELTQSQLFLEYWWFYLALAMTVGFSAVIIDTLGRQRRK